MLLLSEASEPLPPTLERAGIPWGPTGSVGFSIATNGIVCNEASDLDILIQCLRGRGRTRPSIRLWFFTDK
jgi:phosphoribosyl-dephospho-CoA transferase MdcG